jgi:hypothetical protein
MAASGFPYTHHTCDDPFSSWLQIPRYFSNSRKKMDRCWYDHWNNAAIRWISNLNTKILPRSMDQMAILIFLIKKTVVDETPFIGMEMPLVLFP